jgi:murein DD-endopeptidase MepM/ murein hydrolase activator NlpD
MIEIQIHPSDIRRKVRFFFLGHRGVVFGVLSLGVTLLFVLASMLAAPSVIRRMYKSTHLRVMRQEKGIQTERLREHVSQMTSLERTLDDQRVKVEKLLLVYGLEDSFLGHGGDSHPPNPEAASPSELSDAQRREEHLIKSIDKLNRQLATLAQYEAENRELIRHIPSVLPVPPDQFVLTAPFGNRVHPFTKAPDFHNGLDLAARAGTPITASADGVVSFSGRVPLTQNVRWWRLGNVVVINHANKFLSIYAHCNETKVRSGQQVRQGELIATVGSTGWSTNAHLHYEVRADLERVGAFHPVDPRIYILNYQWTNEEMLLSRARSSREMRDFDPLPTAFFGRRRV